MGEILYNKVSAFIRQEQMVQTGDRVLIACSGGVDSVVLLHFLSEQSAQFGIEVGAIHVDHCLRGEESRIDGQVVEELCKGLGIPFYGTTLPVPDLLESMGGNTQEVCRIGRYRLFEETMREHGFSVIAIAHHAEDQLETVLMQLSKGQMPKGMPAFRPFGEGKLIRPFLPLMKEDLYEYVKLRTLPFREDPSNEKDDYTRNRYRHHILPVLLHEHPAAAENSVRMAAGLQEDEDFLNHQAKEQLHQLIRLSDNGVPKIHSAKFRSMHVALQKRVIPLLLEYLYNGEILPAFYNADLLNLLIHQLTQDVGSAVIDLPKGWMLQRDYGISTFVQSDREKLVNQAVPFPPDKWVQWGSVKLRWCKASDVDGTTLDNISEWRYFQLENGARPSIVRSRQPGDRIQLSGMDQPKRVSRLLIDEKVKQSMRDSIPVVVSDQGDVCAIPGIRYSASFTKKPSDDQAYILMMV